MLWDRRFFDPITLAGRKPLETLRDAAIFITELPKAEHDAEEWQAAMTLRKPVPSQAGHLILLQALLV